MELITSVALNGAFLISAIALVALGLGVIYGLLGIINMAHGEMLAIGAYTVVVASEAGLPYGVALLIAPAVGFGLGMLLEALIISRLTTRPLDAILVTLGLSIIVQELLRQKFGGTPRTVPQPVTGTIRIFDVTYPVFRLVVIFGAVATIGVAVVFFARSSFGLIVKSIFQNRDAAMTNGINAAKYNRLAFGVGTALAAFAGSLLAPSTVVIPTMGAFYLGPAFIAVILGGNSRLMAAVAGAIFIGGLEIVLAESYSRTWARALVLVLAIIVIRFRPNGLLREPKARVA